MLYSHTIKLVRFYDGVDGLKTGYTSEAGYCLTATAKKNKMRIIAVVMGEADSKVRNAEISSMLDYAFAQYELEYLLSKESILKEERVYKGKDKYVELVPILDVTVLNKKTEQKKISTYEIKIDDIKAPVKKGDIVGKLIVKENDKEVREIDITVKKDLEKANFIQLYLQYLKDIFKGELK